MFACGCRASGAPTNPLVSIFHRGKTYMTCKSSRVLYPASPDSETPLCVLASPSASLLEGSLAISYQLRSSCVLLPACQRGHGIRWHAHFLFVSPLSRPLSFMKAGVSPLSSRDALTPPYTGLVLWMPEDTLSEDMPVARAKGPCRSSCLLYTKLSLKSLLGVKKILTKWRDLNADCLCARVVPKRGT